MSTTWRALAASVVATGLSTYALDLLATASGAALVATGLLARLTPGWLMTLLALSYAAWGLGLRSNLKVNVALLSATGMSTNVLSKAAYDLARRRTANVRAHRWAAGSGYVGTELLKEAPYYAGAFGVAAVAAPVTSSQAVIFLVGTNLGAMLYEYGLARLTHGYLQRRSGTKPGAGAGQGNR